MFLNAAKAMKTDPKNCLNTKRSVLLVTWTKGLYKYTTISVIEKTIVGK